MIKKPLMCQDLNITICYIDFGTKLKSHFKQRYKQNIVKMRQSLIKTKRILFLDHSTVSSC